MTNLRFTYRFAPNKKPFHVEAIYHDRKFTYIIAKPDETPTLYEIRDGKTESGELRIQERRLCRRKK